MKYLFLSLILLVVGCSKPATINGKWLLNFKIQAHDLPVIVSLNEPYNGVITGELLNSSEKIELNGTYQSNKFLIDIGTAYAKLAGTLLDDGTVRGEWIRTLKKDFVIPFTGSKTQLNSILGNSENQQNLINMSGKWKVSLGADRFGLGVFKQVGSHVTGSILTETGDFRFLNGVIEKNKLSLYGFDGTFSNIFNLVVQNNNMQGMHYSGKKFQQKISATKDDSFELTNPNTLTVLKEGHEFLDLPKMKSLLGEEINLKSDKYLGKVKVVQIFGSWCPNCMDEAMFFVEWRKKNQILLNDVEFIALAWENFESIEQATKALRKYKVKLQMDYPIILMDYKSTKTVLDSIPFQKMISFPTTVFLGKDNKIEKIHTGFAGQATGPYFDLFVKEFEQTLVDLVKK